jgi:hypothetical protein
LRFDLVTFASPADGAPALARWLQSKGCAVFRYDFQPMNMASGFADEELELDEEDDEE